MARLRNLWTDGVSHREIAAALDRSEFSVKLKRRHLGLLARRGVGAILPAARKSIKALWGDLSLSAGDIAARLGVSVVTVHNWRKLLGLPGRSAAQVMRAKAQALREAANAAPLPPLPAPLREALERRARRER